MNRIGDEVIVINGVGSGGCERGNNHSIGVTAYHVVTDGAAAGLLYVESYALVVGVDIVVRDGVRCREVAAEYDTESIRRYLTVSS